jgi:ATP-binding cassette subfamily B protein
VSGEPGPDLETPYWRIEEGAGKAGTYRQMFLRVGASLLPVIQLLRRAAPTASLLTVAAQLLAGLVTASGLIASAAALSRLLAEGEIRERLDSALPLIGLIALLFLVRLGLDALAQGARAWAVPRVHRVAEEQLYAASLRVELSCFDDPGFYDRMHRARDRGVMHLEGSAASVVDGLRAMFAVLGAATALLWLHPLLLPILLVALLPEGIAALAAARLQYAGMATTVALTRQAQMMAELATERDAAAEIRVNRAQPYVEAEFSRSARALEEHMRGLGLREMRALSFGRLASAVGLGLAMLALGGMLLEGMIALAAAGTALIAIRTAAGALTELMQMLNELFQKALYISDYLDFLRECEALQPRGERAQAPSVPGRIELQRVSFEYPGVPGRRVLKDINLRIEPGQTLALVGENGSGKTTLAKLLAGLYRPLEGRILWSGIDLAGLHGDSIADRVSMVLQHPIRWPRSARDNVRLGRIERDDPEALLDAARKARAQEVVDGLSQGWDTLLSRQFRGGTDLSGGQWQRLAVARGLYRDAPLVIWDEPTAPLDARAEAAVYESLRALARGRTTVLITHRLASVRSVDTIVFLEGGAVIEQGSHADLMRLGGRYAELYALQTRLHGFEEALAPA